jgi:ADP-heptose:LPS heptosyltransferase
MKVLLIRAGALGDTLMLMPAIAYLRKMAEITLVGRYPAIDYLSPYVDQCIDYERLGWHGLFMEGAGENPGRGFPVPDHVVAFLSDPEGNVMEKLKAWFPAASIRIFPVFPPPEKDKIHIALYMAQSIEATGLTIDARRCFEDSLIMPLMASQHPFSRNGGIVLHPGSGSTDKNYPSDFWLALIERLKDRYPGKSKRIILLLGPAEEGLLSSFREAVAEKDAELIFCPEKETLIALLNQASLYIGHDSGITHLAAMMGLPVIAIFKKSSPEQWAPLGPAVKIIRDEKGGSDLIEKIIKD